MNNLCIKAEVSKLYCTNSPDKPAEVVRPQTRYGRATDKLIDIKNIISGLRNDR